MKDIKDDRTFLFKQKSVKLITNIIFKIKSSSFKDGFLEIPKIKAAKTDPIPTPAPTKPIVDSPAPINLAACKIIRIVIM